MQRREFLRSGAGLILLSAPLSWLSSSGFATPAEDRLIAGYKAKEITKACQGVDRGQLAGAVLEVNPHAERGLLAHSIGCRYPHKHVLFIAQRYFDQPALLDREADGVTLDGVRAKTFFTSHSFDMSDQGLAEVGVHQHILMLSRADMDLILRQPSGIEKIAYVRTAGAPLVAGHNFNLKL